MHREPRPLPWGALLAVGYCAALVVTLPDFSVTWDELVWFPIGDRQLEYLRTFDRAFLQERPGWMHYGPFAAILSSASAALLHDELGWLAEDTARHLPNALFASLAATALFTLVATRDGRRTAFFAALFFVCLPRWFGDAHANLSDMPAAAGFIASLAALVRFAASGAPGWIVASGVAMGVTGSIRPQTAVFLPLVMSLWILLDARLRQSLFARPARLLCLPISAAAAFYLTWPMFWTAPLEAAIDVAGYFLEPPAGKGMVPVFYLGRLHPVAPPWHYPLVMTAVTTPLATAAAALAGAVAGVSRRRRTSVLLAGVWLLVSIGKHTLMQRGNYDGVRHFLDAFGALAWLSGIGVVALADWLARRLPARFGRALGTLAAVVLLVPSGVALARLHPYPQVYYNGLVGGTAGAERFFETDYWGFTAKDAMRWVNDVAAPGAWVVMAWGFDHARFYQRPDLRVVPATTPAGLETLRADAALRASPPELYFLYFARRGFMQLYQPLLDHVSRGSPSVFAIERGGATLARIHRIRVSGARTDL